MVVLPPYAIWLGATMTIVIVLAITHLLAVGAGIYIGRHFTAKLEIVDKST